MRISLFPTRMNFKRSLQAICLLLTVSGFPQGVASHSLSAPQRTAPDTPAGQQLAGWLAEYNGTDWDAYLNFLKTNFATQPGHGVHNPKLRHRTGGYDLYKIEAETPTAMRALLQERATHNFARLLLQVQPAEPHQIVMLNVTQIEPQQWPAPEFERGKGNWGGPR